MSERVRVTAGNGLRLRDSPRDGTTLKVIPPNTELEVLGRETWLRVNYGDSVGFVLADFVEPQPTLPPEPDALVHIVEMAPHPALGGQALRVDEDFGNLVQVLADEALRQGILMFVTSSLREPYKPVQGAVVTPATTSNHHVGHAFDMNIRFGGHLFGSGELRQKSSLPSEVRSFLDSVGGATTAPLAWGGTFATPDVVHIDDRLNVHNPTLYQRKLLALWGPPPHG